MNVSAQLEVLKRQKQNLIQKIPVIKHFFVDLQFPQSGEKVSFLPIRCFRDFILHEQYSHENSNNFKIFNSSGSTGNKPSQHIFSHKALIDYEQNTCEGFLSFLERNNLNKNTPIVSLVPSVKDWPNSSLSAMISMFERKGLNILWCDLEESLENIVKCLKDIQTHSACVIFGTSFHHFMLAHLSNSELKERMQVEFSRLKLSIIDTGGTKGRTQAFTLEEGLAILKSFYKTETLDIFSEYGMCELGSQAWSSQKIHDGSFQCNETLQPFAVSIEQKSILPLNETGFLAFIDSVNYESYGAIITEDIGYCFAHNAFKLIGRGPDSTLKGCSLNLRAIYNFEKKSHKLLIENNNFKNKQFVLHEIISQLTMCEWNSTVINDLEQTLASIEKGIPTDKNYKNKDILIISAANTPIAWVYPYLIAAESGAKSIVIKVPSLRLDDYYSGVVLKYTYDLIRLIANLYAQVYTYIDQGKSIAHTFNEYDFVLTFGSEETLTTISKQIDPYKTSFIGKGDIKNSLVVNTVLHAPNLIAQNCSVWNGRGCLTPVALFLNSETTCFEKWVKLFAFDFENTFIERAKLGEPEFIRQFCHSHNLLYVSSQIRNIGIDIQKVIHRGKRTCVIDLSSYTEDELNSFHPDFSFGGCGFIYIFNEKLKSRFTELKSLNIFPEIQNFSF
ncbi:hypothetical protein [Fluviispira sanaruensis]|uniref:Acyl-protein synthetase LuxE domain-containing protein n=1 Tax=Fluviispira sanaruensis TaxID=2493639 RepID=A0A4P2VHH9_FLUSA|nr:hypothetical protein [Fluviispira sanaruensis]BBH52171.1 hypothetical protein JCM31447_06110 [Fluviispira sanaruensis]